jgi:hypothetical protein
MPFEDINMDEITDARRKSVAASIRTITPEELKTLGEKIFPMVDHPWRDKFFSFIHENASETFHHATASDGVQFVYCRGKNIGMWFVPGTGMGPVQPQGLAMLKKIVEGH